MKTVVVLRHAERQDRSDNNSHLSQAGVQQVRSMGLRFQHFDFVVTSPLPRAFETAVAMGFAVDMTNPGIQEHSEQIMRDVQWDAGYAAWATAYRSKASMIAYVDHVTSLFKIWLSKVPDDGTLLVITHGGIVEAIATGLSPGDDLVHLGEMAGYVEGFEAVSDDSAGYRLNAVRR